MQNHANSVEEYINQAPEERKNTLQKLRSSILNHLPKGFEEGIQYGMISYFVPHAIYENGYHCNPKEPLPFMSFASQKNSVNVYHMGLYAKKDLYDWFVSSYQKNYERKLDMGKSCIRFKYLNQIPFDLIAELCKKITVNDWIQICESEIKKR
jgi:uncharacterized protein YdhG (YjbR/CyaY superfamily)